MNIWIEGYVITGNSQTAHVIGSYPKAKTFDEAIEMYIKDNPDSGINKNTRKNYVSDEAYENRDSHWNIWGCNIYDNETEARKAFG